MVRSAGLMYLHRWYVSSWKRGHHVPSGEVASKSEEQLAVSYDAVALLSEELQELQEQLVTPSQTTMMIQYV